jgi:hypothetical protein
MTYRDPNLHHEAPYDESRFVDAQSENRSGQSVPPSWHWWLLRLGLAGGIIAVSLQIKSKEGMWIFAVGVLLLLVTIAIGSLRAIQQAWQSSSKPLVNPPKQQACAGHSADSAKPD